MNYSLVKSILEGHWAVSAGAFVKYEPLAKSILNGLEFEVEEERDTVPYMVDRSSKSIGSGKSSKKEEGLVAVIPLIGMMLKYDTSCGPVGTMTIAERLKNADQDPNIDAHILLIDSGGGQAAAVKPLANTIKSLTKPIIAYCDDVMASAALYAASYCDEIWASSNTDMIGSIGTMIAFEGREAISEGKNGIKHIRLYASTSPDKNNEFEEALKGNYKLIINNLLDPFDAEFMEAIRQNRPDVKDEELKGKTYNAKDVVGSLIDGIDSFQNVVNRAFTLAQEKKSDNKNSTEMKKFDKINNVLGVSSLEATDEGVFLNEEQLQSIENALNTEPEIPENFQDTAPLNESLDEIDETVASAGTTAEKITAVGALVAGLRQNPGSPSAKAVKETDDPKEEGSVAKGVDFMADMEAVRNEYL